MKCLVTKLNGVVDNDSILRIGEMSIAFSKSPSPNKTSQGINLFSSGDCDLRIIGDGYFTDETLTQNLGKSKHIVAGSQEDVYVSNGDFNLIISDKYSLRLVNIVPSNTSNPAKTDLAYKTFDLAELKFSKKLAGLQFDNSKVVGDISNLKGLTEIQAISLANTAVKGDIASLAGMTRLTSITITNTSIGGNVSVLGNCKDFTELFALGSSVFGNVSTFANLPKISIIQMMNAEGDIASLASCSVLKFFETTNGNVTGDLSKLPSSTKQANFFNTSSVLSWGSERSSSAYILAINGSPKISNIDNMLINQAKCTVGYIQSIESKKITATGTRTSASDAAVATLQQKGYTVSITPA